MIRLPFQRVRGRARTMGLQSTGPSRRWVLLALCSLLFILSQFYRVSNALIAPQLRIEFAASSEALGVLSAVFFYAFALTQIPLIFILDRMGPRLTMTALSCIGSSGAFLFAFSHGMTGAILGRILLGIGMAGNLMGSMKLFVGWFSPREFATLTGLIMGIGTLGNMFATTPLALLVESFGWRYAFVIMGGITILVTAVFYSIVRDTPNQGLKEGNEEKKSFSTLYGLRLLLTSRDYWIISFGTFCRYGVFVAIQGLWAGPYLIIGLGFSPVKAGNILLLMNIGLFLGGPLAGWLSDHVLHSSKRVIILGLTCMALCLFPLSEGWGRHNPYVLGGIFFIFGAFSAFGIIMYPHIKERLPVEMSGMALTGINLFTMLGGAFFLQVMGRFLDHLSAMGEPGLGDYQVSFLLCFFIIVMALGLYFFTRPGRRGGALEQDNETKNFEI